MKIVLDTNCLIQIVTGRGYKYNVWMAFLKQDYTLCYTTEILCEYEEVMMHFYKDVEFAKAVINVILASPNTEQVDPSYRFRLIADDPDDNKFVDCAITCGATYIVSDDKHFDVLRSIPFPETNVQKLREFARMLSNKRINA